MLIIRPALVPTGSTCPSNIHRRNNTAVLRALKIWGVAALFASSTVLAQSPASSSSRRIFHAPQGLPLTEFYTTPVELPDGKPGELIRSEPSYDYTLRPEVSTFRVLYHSLSPRGEEDVVVSGVVIVPDGTPPEGGWPIIAWAHDFTGSARQCAPSLLRNLNEGPILSMYAGLGYAIVVSDYAGLGTSFPYAALDLRSNALDVIYSVSAARAAVPELGTRWVAAGYSQGALVAAKLAEAESEIGDPGYLGAVAISGVVEPQEMFAHLALGPDHSMLVFLAAGIKTVFPEFRVEDMLTEKAMRLYQYISHSCEVRLGPEPEAREMLKPDWGNNAYVKRFFVRNSLGRQPAFGPLLVIGGETDAEVPPALAAAAVARLCEQKDRVLFVKYRGPNASSVLGNSVSEQVSWIRARFSGLPGPGNCP